MLKKNSKIFLAGHKGMVGSAILRKLNKRGYKKIIREFGFENSNFNKLRLNLESNEDEPL